MTRALASRKTLTVTLHMCGHVILDIPHFVENTVSWPHPELTCSPSMQHRANMENKCCEPLRTLVSRSKQQVVSLSLSRSPSLSLRMGLHVRPYVLSDIFSQQPTQSRSRGNSRHIWGMPAMTQIAPDSANLPATLSLTAQLWPHRGPNFFQGTQLRAGARILETMWSFSRAEPHTSSAGSPAGHSKFKHPSPFRSPYVKFGCWKTL